MSKGPAPLSWTPRCVLSGGYLLVPNENKAVIGDLYKVGTGYVFIAPVREGLTAWAYGVKHIAAPIRYISVDSVDFLDKRGVVMFTDDDMHGDKATLDFIRGGK